MLQRINIVNGKVVGSQVVPEVQGIRQVMSILYDRLIPFVVNGYIDYIRDRKGNYIPNITVCFLFITGEKLHIQTIQDGSSLIYLWNKRGYSRKDILQLICDLSDKLYKQSRVKQMLSDGKGTNSFAAMCYKHNLVNVFNEHSLFEKPCYSVFSCDFENYSEWLNQIELALSILNQNYIKRTCSLSKPRATKYVFKVLYSYKGLNFMLDLVKQNEETGIYVTYLEKYRENKVYSLLYPMVLCATGNSNNVVYNLSKTDLINGALFEHYREFYTVNGVSVTMPCMTFKLKGLNSIIKYMDVLYRLYINGITDSVELFEDKKKRVRSQNGILVFDGILADWYVVEDKLQLCRWKANYAYLGKEFTVLTLKNEDMQVKNETVALCNLVYKEVKRLSKHKKFSIITNKGKEGTIASCLDFMRLFILSKFDAIIQKVKQNYDITGGILTITPMSFENEIAEVISWGTKYLTKDALLCLLENNRDIVSIFYDLLYNQKECSQIKCYFDALYLDNVDFELELPSVIYKCYKQGCNQVNVNINALNIDSNYNIEIHQLYNSKIESAISLTNVERIKLALKENGIFILYSKVLAQVGNIELCDGLVSLDKDSVILLLLETLELACKEALVI